MKCSLFHLAVAAVASVQLAGAAEPKVRFFESRENGDLHTIALRIEGDEVSGTQVWQPAERDGSRGYFQGKLKEDKAHVVYHYTIEGSEQSEEQVFRIGEDRLWIGTGELVDPDEEGKLSLKNIEDVKFDTALEELDVRSPEPGTKLRREIMDAMRGPVSKEIGEPVQFTGDLRVFGEWARFQGDAATRDGTPPKNEEAAFSLDLDLFVLLKREQGKWRVLYHAFAGDIGPMEEAQKRFPKAPWVLFN